MAVTQALCPSIEADACRLIQSTYDVITLREKDGKAKHHKKDKSELSSLTAATSPHILTFVQIFKL